MKSPAKILADIRNLDSSSMIINYWDDNNTIICDSILNDLSDKDIVIQLLYLFTRVFNDNDKYAKTYFIHRKCFINIKDQLPLENEHFLELIFQLAKGLYFDRNYAIANQYFNFLAYNKFDTQRFNDWWDSAAYADIREKKLDKNRYNSFNH